MEAHTRGMALRADQPPRDGAPAGRQPASRYDLRDTFATTQDWGKLPRVSKQLGHASVITTEKHYYKFKPSAATAGYVDRIRGESSHRAPTTD